MASLTKRLLAAGFAAVATITVASLSAELYLRRHPLPSVPVRGLQSDPLLGWDSIPRIVPLDNAGRARVVYFVGDSFTQDRRWPFIAQREAEKQGVAFDGYSLGVSGFGTTQEWLKTERDFEFYRPQLVVVQLFAWNDLRDNWSYPPIAYSPDASNRPYLVPTASGFRLAPAVSAARPMRWLIDSALWRQVLFRATLRIDDTAARAGIDRLADWHLALPVHYTEPATWEPFYRRDGYETAYVRGAFAVTREAFRRLSTFLSARGAKLIVIGLDNPFTVDEDVALAWIRPGTPFDPNLPLSRVAAFLREDGVPFESARPALLDARRRTGRKVYNPPAGELSGHLEPAGEEAFGTVAARMIVSLRP